MELTQKVIDIVESRKLWDADAKQGFYLGWLEADEDKSMPDFEDDEHLVNYINVFYHNIFRNAAKTEANRRRLEFENDAEIRSTFGYNNTGDDPADIVQGKEEIFTRVKTLSDTLKRTLNEVILTGSSYAEAAEKEGVPEGAIRKRVSDIMRVVKGE